MTTLDTTDPVPVDPVHADPETPWEPPLAGTETEALLGALGGRVGEDPPPGWRPVAGDSAVWDG